MSEVCDAPRAAEYARNADLLETGLGGAEIKGRNKRRSARRAFDAVIRLYGSSLNGNPFYEDARTINVSVHGALLVLNVSVAKGQKLLLGRGGKLEIAMDSVRLADGEKAALRATKEAQGGGHTGVMTAGIIATGLIFWPVAPVFPIHAW